MKTIEQMVDEFRAVDLNVLNHEQAIAVVVSIFGKLNRPDFFRAMAILDEGAKKNHAEAEQLQRMGRLAAATGCPEHTPIFPWLAKKGLIRFDGTEYVFTEKATALRVVEPSPQP
jgi:hypothetical protein